MNRFTLSSNIYNQNDIIKTASELGTTLFRKFNNLFIFKSLIAGNNISISESDNFITINSSPSIKNYMVLSLKGITENKPLFNIKSSNDIYMSIIGNIGDCDISFNTCCVTRLRASTLLCMSTNLLSFMCYINRLNILMLHLNLLLLNSIVLLQKLVAKIIYLLLHT